MLFATSASCRGWPRRLKGRERLGSGARPGRGASQQPAAAEQLGSPSQQLLAEVGARKRSDPYPK